MGFPHLCQRLPLGYSPLNPIQSYMYIYIWVNYYDLTATSLEIMVSKGNHPQMAARFRLVNYYNLPRDIYIYISPWKDWFQSHTSSQTNHSMVVISHLVTSSYFIYHQDIISQTCILLVTVIAQNAW